MFLGVSGLQCTGVGKLIGKEALRVRSFAGLVSNAKNISLVHCQRRTIFSQTSLYKYFTLKTPPEWSSFDSEWEQATESQKESIRAHYDALQRGNWKDLTLDQMRNCYTVGYGAPESPILQRRDKILVFIGTFCAVGTGVGLYGFLRLFAMPEEEGEEDLVEREALERESRRHRGYDLYKARTAREKFEEE